MKAMVVDGKSSAIDRGTDRERLLTLPGEPAPRLGGGRFHPRPATPHQHLNHHHLHHHQEQEQEQ